MNALGNCRRLLLAALLSCLPAGVLAAEPAERAYQAQWIWGKAATPEPFQFMRFRKSLELSAAPSKATAFISADTFYRLWINGQLVMHGPARSGGGTATIDAVDVQPYLAQGSNSLIIEVFHGVSLAEVLAQAPGLFCEVEAVVDDTPRIVAATDQSWEAAEITAWSRESLRFSFQRGWMENIDGRKVLEEQWQAALVLGPAGTGPWKTLLMRDVPLPAPLLPARPVEVLAIQRGDGTAADIPPRKHYEPPRPAWDRLSEWFRRLETEHLRPDITAATNPAGVTKLGQGDAILHGDGASVSYDLGLGYSGFPEFEVTGRAGQVLEFVWNEQLNSEGDIRPRAQTGNNAIRYVLRDGRQRFVGFMAEFGRFVRVVLRGEGDLTLHRVSLIEYHFAGEQKGNFRCSDDQLNLIYNATRHTAVMVTLDAYMDTPNRERNAMYGMEAYSTLRSLYPMFGDTSVSRRGVLNGAASVNVPERVGPPGLIQCCYPMQLSVVNSLIPGGSMWWVLHLGVYERCSGDTELVRSMIPVLRANLAAIATWADGDGLLDGSKIVKPFWFFDYSDIRMADGVSVALNATYLKTLEEAARLERLAGDAAEAERDLALAQRVRQGLNPPSSGALFYPDVYLRSEKGEMSPSKEASETTQYYAMWAKVPSPERLERMWQAMRDDFVPTPRQKVQPIQGLARGGLYGYFARREVATSLGDYPALVRDLKAQFLPMVEGTPGTLWEDTMGDIALCHGICCELGGILTEEVLGIRLGLPLKITPHNCGLLRWANGYLTTPKGQVAVSWNIRKNRYELQISTPKDLAAEVTLPPEAQAIWQTAAAVEPWRAVIPIRGDTTIVVEPGKVTAQ